MDTLPAQTSPRWRLSQRWSQLLFAHWPLPARLLRPLIPPALEIDTYQGDAWVGIVPFYMSKVHLNWLPTIPGTGEFCELNVRTYVTYKGNAGVWFFSLDASSPLAVLGARRLFKLPYFTADMRLVKEQNFIHYHARRIHPGAVPAFFEGSYVPTTPPSPSRPGTLEHWLTERYCLYASTGRGRVLYRADIQHAPWPLQQAEADFRTNTMAAGGAIRLPKVSPLLHYAEQIDVQATGIYRV
jgi:hypothetical protein